MLKKKCCCQSKFEHWVAKLFTSEYYTTCNMYKPFDIYEYSSDNKFQPT